MKVNDPNLSSTLASTGASRTQGTAQPGQARSAENAPAGQTGDDIHLSELVRSLRALAPDSPHRQEHLEQIARTYASGTYKVDPQATAAKIVDDALQS